MSVFTSGHSDLPGSTGCGPAAYCSRHRIGDASSEWKRRSEASQFGPRRQEREDRLPVQTILPDVQKHVEIKRNTSTAKFISIDAVCDTPDTFYEVFVGSLFALTNHVAAGHVTPQWGGSRRGRGVTALRDRKRVSLFRDLARVEDIVAGIIKKKWTGHVVRRNKPVDRQGREWISRGGTRSRERLLTRRMDKIGICG